NGKIDRAALPKPEGVRWESATTYQSPQTETETRIAKIWQDVLQLERVGTRDNFFDLGGHSLLLIQVRNTLEPMFERSIPATTLLEHPTISSLAAFLTQSEPAASTLADSRARAEMRKDLARQQRELWQQRNKVTT